MRVKETIDVPRKGGKIVSMLLCMKRTATGNV